MNNDENIAFLADMFDFNPIVVAIKHDTWLTDNGNRKVAYTFLNIDEEYYVNVLDNDLIALFGLRRRKQGGVIFYASENPIAELSKLLYNDETKLRVRWV